MTNIATARSTTNRRLALLILVGSAVAVALGVYGNVHDPTGRSLVTVFFSSTINAKVWLGTIAVALVGFQLVTALRIYGRLGTGPAPTWMGGAHRLSGTAAFWLSIPVAYHCLWALGFTADAGSRVLAHSLLGTFFYGAFAAKVLAVRSRDLPSWVLPVLGGTVFSTLVLIWFTSSFWFFTNIEFPGF